MRVLITGAAGMLGHDVRSSAAALGHQVVALPRASLDVCDAAAVEAAVAAARPDCVVNCAAWTDVDGAETAFEDAVRVNGTGAGHVARAAFAAGAWTIHVSSDYVFDGRHAVPYVESDPVDPQSAYGRSKLAGEVAVAQAAPGLHTIVRSSWLFGIGGPCFPATILRLARERSTLSVVDDQVGCPTYTGHLATALVSLAASRVPGVLHVAADGQCSWFQFAREIVAAAGPAGPAGSAVEITPCTTAEFPRPAPRPAYSVLRSERGLPVSTLPDWRSGLRAYMDERMAAAA